MYCVNKVKGYLNFYVNNLNFLKKGPITLKNEQHSECNNYKQY